jgi:hypothetical protein
VQGDVIVLASGCSVADYNLRDLETRGTLIAVSGAALYVKPHIALSMDRRVAEYCYPMWRNQGVPEIWLRSCIARNFTPAKDTRMFTHDIDNPTSMSLTKGFLNGSNTGTCALNLALQLQPKRIFLLGFDMQRGDKNEPYWHPPYPWNTEGGTKSGKLKEWSREFVSIASQCKMAGVVVSNVNHRSLITAFPVVDYARFRKVT